MSKENRRGQTILEVILALAIIVVVLVGLVRIATVAVRNTSSSQSEALTARYGTEVSEWLKSNRDNLGWVRFASNLAPYQILNKKWCLTGPLIPNDNFQNSFTSSCGYIQGTNNLTRTVQISQTTKLSSRDQSIDFTIDITWNDGSVLRTAEYISRITSVESP